jgi:hypothetical protein
VIGPDSVGHYSKNQTNKIYGKNQKTLAKEAF